MIRFLLFIVGAVAGLITAVFVLPIPGKTFFNKLSRLPQGAKDLIDDSIDLGISVWKLSIGFTEDIIVRLSETMEIAKDKAELMRQQLEHSRKLDYTIKHEDEAKV